MPADSRQPVFRRARVRLSVPFALTLFLLCAGLAQAGSVTVLPPVTGADGRLGLCDVLAGAPAGSGTTWAQLAANAGARVNRWEFRWDQIEPSLNTWNFGPTDADVSSSRAAGLDVLGVIDGTPAWGAAPGQPPGNGVPRGLNYPLASPRNRWASFIRGLVRHYAGQVKYWEIWNEPDLHFFWNGSAADYAATLRTAYRVIKQTDPSATVVMAGMVVPDLTFVRTVLALVRPPARRAFDIAAWHAYGPAVSLLKELQRLHSTLHAAGYGTAPIWVTEDGFPAANPNGEPRQAAYILQTIAYAFVGGARNVLVYRASDDTTGKEWGIMSGDGTPREGYVALQVAAQYLSGVQDIVHDPTEALERFVFYEPGRRVTLIWNRTVVDQPVSLPAPAAPAELINWQGGQSDPTVQGTGVATIAPGATYNIKVDPAGNVVGGPPLLLVEGTTPPDGLNPDGLLSAVSGSQRLLVAVNAGTAPVTVQVASTGRPDRRELVSVAPQSIGTVDLDLLAGPHYAGMYTVASTGPITLTAAGKASVASDNEPVTQWYVPAAPAGIPFRNQSASSASVTVTSYDAHGHRRERTVLQIPPNATVAWQRPAGTATSAVVTSTSPVVPLAGAGIAAPQTSSYLLGRPGPVTLFNPGPGVAHLEAHFAGNSAVKGVQLRLPTHHSFRLDTYGAQAVVLTADHPVAAAASTPASAAPATSAGLATAGPLTHIAIYNPATQPARVTLSVLNGNGTTQITRTVAPGKVLSVHARSASAPPAGVLLQSDVPVVALPTR